MDALNNRRARLRHELQQAYDLWMVASERQAGLPAYESLDISGSPEAAKAQWFDYLAAKERLVQAWAEQPPAV